jgi:CRP-like cAMP-binding protein
VTQGKTIIVVTHDSGLAKRTDRAALILDGEIVNEYVSKAMPTLTQEQVWQATHSAKRLAFEPGAMILKEGTNAESFYIVVKGMVEVILPRENQSDVIALQLGPGKYFGEIEFFHEKKHKASIRASERGPVEVLCITYDQLNELLGESPVTRDALQKSAAKHEAENIARRSPDGVPGKEAKS